MTAQQIMKRITAEGSVWLGGEMEFPAGLTCREAYEKASHIAEECGYTVAMRGRSILSITGGDIAGSVELDWYDSQRPGPECVRVWTCEAAYAPEKSTGPQGFLQTDQFYNQRRERKTRRVFFLEGHGKDCSFDRWRVSAYYAHCLAMTIFFPTEEAYNKFLSEKAPLCYAEYSAFRAAPDPNPGEWGN